jgi:periplasmic divalent cation tolerance protein
LEEAERIATILVETRLAAGVNIIPEVTSVYRWQGRVETDTEAKLIIKTLAQAVSELTKTVAALHCYEVCEVTVIPIVNGSADYLAWIRENVG